jgi:hypothetical protein
VTLHASRQTERMGCGHHLEWGDEANGGRRSSGEVALAAHSHVYPNTSGRLDEHNTPFPLKNPGRVWPCRLFSGTFSPLGRKHATRQEIESPPRR